MECKISHFQSLIFFKLRSKLLSCQSAEAPETQVTSMTMKRRTSTSRKRKSARKSLPIFSWSPGLPSELTRLGKCALSWGGWGGTDAHSFISHSWIRSFLPWFSVCLALIYKQVHHADFNRTRQHFFFFFFYVPQFHFHAIIIWNTKWLFCPNWHCFGWGCPVFFFFFIS